MNMSDQAGPQPPPIPHGTKPVPPRPSQAIPDASVQSITKVNAIYYPNYRVYRGETPNTLNYGFISHVFYAFAHVGPDGNVFLSDEEADLNISCDGVRGCIGSFMQIKQRHSYLKLVLSIGGGGASNNFAKAAASASTRDNFARSAKSLIDASGFDGIDIDWEHPSDWQQGQDFLALLATVRLYLPTGRYLLTTALPSAEWALRHIEVWRANEYLDFINLMAYDFTNPARAGYHAQLYPRNPGEDSGSSGVDFLISHGFPAKKILLGVPCYGRSFLGATAAGDAAHGQGGSEGTFEYKDLPRCNTEERVNPRNVSAYCVGGDGGFTSYDNPETVRIKADYCKCKGLAGLFYWTGTADHSGTRSLITTGFRGLHNA